MRTYFYQFRPGSFSGLTQEQSRAEIRLGLDAFEQEVNIRFIERDHGRRFIFQWNPAAKNRATWLNPEIEFSSVARYVYKSRPRLIQAFAKHELLHAFGYRASRPADRWGHSNDPLAIFNINQSSDYFSLEEFEWLHRRFGRPDRFWPLQLSDIGSEIRKLQSKLDLLWIRHRDQTTARNAQADQAKRRQNHENVKAILKTIRRTNADLKKYSKMWRTAQERLTPILDAS